MFQTVSRIDSCFLEDPFQEIETFGKYTIESFFFYFVNPFREYCKAYRFAEKNCCFKITRNFCVTTRKFALYRKKPQTTKQKFRVIKYEITRYMYNAKLLNSNVELLQNNAKREAFAYYY